MANAAGAEEIGGRIRGTETREFQGISLAACVLRNRKLSLAEKFPERSMRPLVAAWPYALLFWAVFIWSYAPEFVLNRRARPLLGPQDAGSFRFVVIVQMTAMTAAFAIAFAGRFGGLKQQRLWFWIGLAAMAGGSLLRRHCFRMLGKSFTAAVVVAPDQAVIERGAYRWVRHPSYTAAALVLVGTILALGNWVSVAIILAAAALSYGYRVRVEERALVETLGEPYRAYMRRTKRFIPMIV
jgi:protein-S-isoprenylcysteine O-methyltransferase Ste14